MPKKPQLLTKLDLQLARSNGKSKVSCINGLEIRIHENGNMYYQYRHIGSNYKTTAIGSDLVVDLSEAQKTAAKMRATERALQKKKKEQDFIETARLCARKDDNKTAVLSLDEIGNTLHCAERWRCFNSRPATIQCAIRFIALTPIAPKDLLLAKWNDFNRENNLLLIGRPGGNSESIKNPAQYYLTTELFNELSFTPRGGAYIFHSSDNLERCITVNNIDNELQKISHNRKAIQFRDSFRHYIKNLNQFNASFIDEISDGFKKRKQPLSNAEIETTRYVLWLWKSIISPYIKSGI